MYNAAMDGEYEVIGEAHWQILENNQQGADEPILKIYGFKQVRTRLIFFHVISVLLLGIPYLILSWYPKYSKLKFVKCSLKTADILLVTNHESIFNIEKVQEVEMSLSSHKDNKVRFFEYQHTRYIWIKDQDSFINVQSLNEKLTINILMENTSGINKRQQSELIKLYGPNSIEVQVKSYWSLFVNEVFNPFYLFQVGSIILWSLDEYYQYAACVFVLSAGSCITSLYQTKKLSIMLHELVESSAASGVSVVRPGTARRGAGSCGGGRAQREQCVVAASRLVPGDILLLPPAGCVMPCDALLLTGTAILNESMLTGESVPVMKSPPNLSSEVYSTETHKRHTLFSGTQVIQTRFYGNSQVLAKVVRTGFYTAKGELVKSILYPKPFGFQFYKDAAKFVVFLFALSALGMAYCIWLYVERGSSISMIILRTLDIITIVVPPALPAAMTAGTVYSQRRLRNNNIFCISPPRINVAGKLQVICFDKTGTLTEDGLDLYAVIPWRVEGGGEGPSAGGEQFGALVREVGALPATSPLLQALASCHSLTSVGGELTGDPLDLKMFEFTKWVLEEPGPESTRYDNLAPAVVKPPTTSEAALLDLEHIDPLTMEIPYEVGLLRRFHFSSTQQSMGVIARVLGQPQMVYFVKGAPEKVAGMCRPDTLPDNFGAVLNEYTSNGYRVIGLACRRLERRMKWVDTQRVKREQLECGLTFLGLLVMQNSLKPETAAVIADLHQANMRMVMVTGDNIMTAMSVSRVCGMVPAYKKLVLMSAGPASPGDQKPPLLTEVVGEGVTAKMHNGGGSEEYALALEGRTWNILRQHYPDVLPEVLAHGAVFGRFGPDQKTQLVTALQGEGWVVGMCGDGANDCGALKAAHIGVSLSQAEASVAAPFTSREQNIRCVKHLAMEGRCALSTSFAIFKYMALYSLIQFFSVLILYNAYSILGNMQFLYIDLVLTTLLALGMGRAGPAAALTARCPPVSLVAPSTTLPLTAQVMLCLALQLAALCILAHQPWFKAVQGGPDVEEVLCWENTVIFIVSSFQYLVLACVYSKGQPFRQPFFTNYFMVASIASMSAFTVLLLVCPVPWLAGFMEVQLLRATEQRQNVFRLYLLLLPLLHLLLAVAVETFLSDGERLRALAASLRGKKARVTPERKPSARAPWIRALNTDTEPC